MPFPVQKYVRTLNRFCIANKAFTPEDVEKIKDLEDLQKFRKGAVGQVEGGGRVNKKTRDSDIMWIEPSRESEWLFQKFSHLVSMVNYDHFMYDIEGFDNFQYTRYNSKDKQHYNWHVDAGNASSTFERKISASVILTDPKEYDGGEFEIIIHGNIEEPTITKPELGDVVFFDSRMPHRVRPVTSGIRKSLVCWVMGKNIW
jgi:PKHD-type hydroxylase